MRHRNMLVDVMVLNMEQQLVELAGERFGKPLEECSDEEAFYVVIEMTKRIIRVCEKNNGEKKAYVISMDYLSGRMLGNNLMNLGIYQRMREILASYGKSLCRLEEMEEDLPCRQGSLAVVTASLVDSATTLGIPMEVLSLYYGDGTESAEQEGRQSILQVEQRKYECWANYARLSFDVNIAGLKLKSAMHEISVVGYADGINKARLFNLIRGEQDLSGSDRREWARLLEIIGVDKLRRLVRQYFLASNAAQVILREMKTRKYDLRKLDEHAAIQICGASAGLIIPELIRILVEDKAMNFMAAVGVVISSCAYTIFTAPSEEPPVWSVSLLARVAPQIMSVIRQINLIVQNNYEEKELQIIDGNEMVHLDRICMHFTSRGSFVSKVQGKIMMESCLAPFAKAYTDRFSTRTAGISLRLWMCAGNQALSRWIRKQIGERYRGDNKELENLLLIPQEEVFLQSLLETKKPARRLLMDYVSQNEGERLLREGIIDVVTGSCSKGCGYKMTIKYIEHKIAQIQQGVFPARPINFLFGGCDAQEDLAASEIARRLRELQGIVNRDPLLSPHLKVIYLHDYSVICAQYLTAAADLAEELRAPQTVSAGTTGMKFMVNGAVTLGQRGGCAEEIRSLVGDENIYMFDDADSYIREKDRMLADYEDRTGWAVKILTNIAKSHHFSSDLTVERCNREIWKI